MHFVTKTIKIEGDKCRPSTLKVEIYSVKEDLLQKIGEYHRDYHLLHKTFHPFKHKDKYYALYSPHYKETRIMELPSCNDYCAVEGKFSPVEYYVPSYYDMYDAQKFNKEWNKQFEEIAGTFGFISGCYWGDDTSWKIGYIDLTGLEEKIVKIDFRFGYIAQPISLTLSQCVDLSDFSPSDNDYSITISRCSRYDIKKHYLGGDPILLGEENLTPRYKGLNLNSLTKSQLISVILGQKQQK